jgi:hypothetical protein
MTLVIQDKTLFRALVKCLQANDQDDISDTKLLSGRKRALSITRDNVPNKAIKVTHSPVTPASRQRPVLEASLLRKPRFNIPVLAATILFTSFQYIDHWPAALVKAYADDCFGSRSWVDAEECRAFVENLALVHSAQNTMDEDYSEEFLNHARVVADRYRVSACSNSSSDVKSRSGTSPSSSTSSVRRSLSGDGSIAGSSPPESDDNGNSF